MTNPYSVLGLEHNADEATIRQRYLELVRQYPPEREPVKAAEIRSAYDKLRNPIVRLQGQLFDDRAHHTLESLIESHQPELRGHRFPTALLLSLGRS